MDHAPSDYRNRGIALDEALVSQIAVNPSAVARRVQVLRASPLPTGAVRAAWLLRAIALTDVTSLAGDDTPARIAALCGRARSPVSASVLERLSRYGGIAAADVRAAAVCVYPDLVEAALEALRGSGVPVAAVGAGFPSGLTPLDARRLEVEAAAAGGAREIDVVIRRHLVLRQRWRALYDEVAALRQAAGDAHLKVILAVGELGGLNAVARASWVALMAGADFIKTSTGKESVNATLETGMVMLQAVRQYGDRTGMAAGFKAAGGIRRVDDALYWLRLARRELGPTVHASDPVRPDRFRFGASSLLDAMDAELVRIAAEARGGGAASASQTAAARDQPAREATSPDAVAERPMTTIDEETRSVTPATARAWLSRRQAEMAVRASTACIDIIDIIDPMRGACLARCVAANGDDVDRAVASASPPGCGRAFTASLAREVAAQRALFIELLALEGGVPIGWASRHELPAATRSLEDASSLAGLPHCFAARRSALGVVGLTAPRRVAFSEWMGTLAPLLATGNAVVAVAPAGLRLATRALSELAAGIQPNVLLALAGEAEAARTLADHPALDAHWQPELLGPSASIVFEGADLDSAVDALAAELCSAGELGVARESSVAGESSVAARIHVQEGIADAVEARLLRRWRDLRFGDPLDPHTEVGPCRCPESELESWARRAREEGATVHQVTPSGLKAAGAREAGATAAPPAWRTPRLATKLGPTSRTAQHPVPAAAHLLLTFRTPDEALRTLPPRLSTLSLWTENMSVVQRATTLADARSVFVNSTPKTVAEPGCVARSTLRTAFLRATRPTAGNGPIAPGDAHAERRPRLAAGDDDANRERLERALDAAEAAGPGWSDGGPRRRGKVLAAWADRLNTSSHRAEGEPPDPFQRAAECLRAYAARAALGWAGLGSPLETLGLARVAARVIHRPQGIIVIALPSIDALPSTMDTGTHDVAALVALLAPALIAGNRVVVAASPERVPGNATLARLGEAADALPAGVFSLVAARSEDALRRRDRLCRWYAGRDAKDPEVVTVGRYLTPGDFSDDLMRLSVRTRVVYQPQDAPD